MSFWYRVTHPQFRIPRGIQLPELKDRTLASMQVDHALAPKSVTISLRQSTRSGVQLSLTPVLRNGDLAFIGTRLAQSEDSRSVPVFSSMSGRVVEVSDDFMRLESDGDDQMESSIQIQQEIPSNPKRLIDMIREAGVVDLGGSGAPIHEQLASARANDVETVILDASELEPYLTADQMLMMNYPAEVLKGAELLRIASGAKRAVIISTRDKREACEVMNSKNYRLKMKTVETMIRPLEFPQNSKRMIAQMVTGHRLRPGENLFRAGVFVENVATAFAVFEAIYLRKPLYERVVAVTGACVAEPKNLWVRSGMTVSDLLASCRGLLRDPGRIVLGGPITGKTIDRLDAPFPIGASGLVALPPEALPTKNEEACIRCGECVEVCPEDLNPEALTRAASSGNAKHMTKLKIESCTECGACAYICPSQIPMVSILRDGKEKLQPQPILEPEIAGTYESSV